MQLSYAESVDQAPLTGLIAELNNAVFNVLTAEQQQQLQQKIAAHQGERDALKDN